MSERTVREIALFLLLPLFACAHRDDKPTPPYVRVPITSVKIRGASEWMAFKPQLQQNFDALLPLFNTDEMVSGPTLDIFLLRGFVAPGPKAGQCAISYRMNGTISLHLWSDNPEGQCGGSGTISRDHWSGGLGWEFAHWYDCQKTKVCGDGAYASPEAAALDKAIHNSPWIGEEIP